jgi:hypothetical protein
MKKIQIIIIVISILTINIELSSKDVKIDGISKLSKGTFPQPFYDIYNVSNPKYPNNSTLGNPHNNTAISTGYYFVDSDQYLGNTWKIDTQFADTNEEKQLWTKIASGPRQKPNGYWKNNEYSNMGFPFFRNPALPTQNNGDFFETGVAYGTDSTDDAIAGPIAFNLNKSFYFNGIRYDSLYVSTNGIICLTNRRYFYDTDSLSPNYKKRKLNQVINSAYDPESMDWFVNTLSKSASLNVINENRFRYGNGLNDSTQDDFGYKYAVLGGQYSHTATNWATNPPSPLGGIRAKGGSSINDLSLSIPSNITSGYNDASIGGPLDGIHKAAVIAPFFSDLMLSQYSSSTSKIDNHSFVMIKRDTSKNKMIIYYVNASLINSLKTPIGNFYGLKNLRPNEANYISANAQVILDANDNSVAIFYERFNGGYKNGSQYIPASTLFRYNSICGVRGFARHINFNRTGGPTSEPFNSYTEYEQYTNYFENEQSPDALYPRSFHSVKFKQWQNTLRTVDIQYRIRKQDTSSNINFSQSVLSSKVKNYELLIGDKKLGAIQPTAIFQNLSNDIQGPKGINYIKQDLNFQTRFVIINKATGRYIYNRTVPINNTCLSIVDPNWNNCVQDIDVRVNYLGKSDQGIYSFNKDVNTFRQTFAGKNDFNSLTRNGLPTYEYVHVYFPPFEPNDFDKDANGNLLNIGNLKAIAIAEPINLYTLQTIGDKWPFDDTLSVNLFTMKRLDSFNDDVSEYHVIDNNIVPSFNKWVSINADVVDGEEVSRYPQPPRGKFTATNYPTYSLNSPVIRLNRKTLYGEEPETSPGGDEIRSFPIDMLGRLGSVLSFSIQRVENRKDWDRSFGDNTLIGPEPRVILNGDIFTPFNTTNMAVSANPNLDRLSVQLLKPSNDGINDIINPTEDNWRYHPRRKGASPETKVDAFTLFGAGGYMRGFLENDKDSSLALPEASSGKLNALRANMFDDGFDLEYNKYFIAIPDTFIKWQKSGAKNFRFRMKVLANDDQKCATCIPDDNDDFFVDNIRILFKPKETTDVEVISCKLLWPYTQAPASQATNIPVRVKLSNNTSASAPFYIVKTKIFKNYSGPNDLPVYCRAEVVPNHDPVKEIEFKMPNFNSRLAGPGKFRMITNIKILGGDLVPSNDTNYTDFEIKYGNSFAYDPIDNVTNDVPEAIGKIGRGINLEGFAEGGSGSANGPTSSYDEVQSGAGYIGGSISGSIAVKFELLNADTIFGYQAYFGTTSSSPDAVALAVHRDAGGNNPGAIISGSLIYRYRGRDDLRKDIFYGQYVDYSITDANSGKPKPLVLSAGTYWISIAQIGETGFELGASKSRMGMRTMNVGIPTPIYNINPVGENGSSFLLNKEFRQRNSSGNMVNNNLFAVENSRGSGQWLGFMPSVGNPAYAHLHHFGTNPLDKQTLTLNRGGWIPLLRPVLGYKGYSTKIEYEDWCVDIPPVELTFFKGASRNDGIDLYWETASEINSDKFIVEKRNAKSDEADDWAQVFQIKAHGSSKVVNSYNWTDKNVVPKEAYQYRLRQVDLDGTQNCYTTNIVTVTYDKNLEFAIYPNSPNPFTNNTNISFTNPNSGIVKVEILDISGNVVTIIQDKEISAGTHTIEWNGRYSNGNLLSSGTYLCRISSDGRTETIKMTIKR